MLKEEGSEARGRQLKSQRERELEELRSRGVAKTRREKLKFYSGSLQTALESKRFLLQCHIDNKKTFKPKYNPSTVGAIDYNSFLMNQSKRQRELKMRRKEAEQLLHGFRGFYGESFASWSPRHAKSDSQGRFSFGAEDALRDPDDDSTRRDTYCSQMDSEWGDQEDRDDSSRYSTRFIPQPLDPSRGDFLIDGRHYDGTGYERSQQDMEVSSGVEMFSPSPRTLNRYLRPPLSGRSGRSSTSGRRASEFFKSPKSTSGGNVESDANDPTPNESSDFVDDDEETEFRERPPSTTRSSTSNGKAFFTSPTNAGGFESPYEPRRMKLYTPTSAASNGGFGPDGYPDGYDDKVARQFNQTGDQEDFNESAMSPSFRYEPPRMKIYTPTGTSSHTRTPTSASRKSYDPSGTSSETFEPTSDEFTEGAEGESRNFKITGKKSDEEVERDSKNFQSSDKMSDEGTEDDSSRSFKISDKMPDDSTQFTSAIPYEKRGTRANNSGEKLVEDAGDEVSGSAGFDGSDHNEKSVVDVDPMDMFRGSIEFDESDHYRKPRKSEDPDGREPGLYPERRLKLQINTQREDEISDNRLRETGNEGVIGSWRGKSQEIERVPSEDSRIVSARHKKSAPKVTENAAPEEPKKEPVPLTIWRDFISDEPGAKFPPEAGRYHLYASYACPGSHRSLIVRALKGLEDVVSVTIVHPTWRHTNPENPKDKHRGWIFGDPDGKPFHNTMGRGGPFPAAYPGNDPDPVLNAYSVRNLYEHAKDTSGKYTIPLLWDTKLNTIVNNESSDIAYMLNSSFNKFAKNPELDLYTEDDDEGLDRLNEVSQWLYPMMIHGVYRCGFAKTQRAYDRAIDELTAAFDAADALLQEQRYLTGDTLTDADIRFFVTLIRFDEVYAFYFRANTRLVLMTPSLLNFCREIYQMPGVAETCQMDQIKAHFFGSHAEWNKYSVVPRGLDFMRYLDMPHDRENFSTLGHF